MIIVSIIPFELYDNCVNIRCGESIVLLKEYDTVSIKAMPERSPGEFIASFADSDNNPLVIFSASGEATVIGDPRLAARTVYKTMLSLFETKINNTVRIVLKEHTLTFVSQYEFEWTGSSNEALEEFRQHLLNLKRAAPLS